MVKSNNESGQVLIVAVLFFTLVSGAIALGIANPVLRQVADRRDLIRSENSYYLSESLAEDLAYRIKTGKQVPATASLSLSGQTATATVAEVVGGKLITSNGFWENDIRRVSTIIYQGTGASFHYGVQTGPGGMSFANSSSVSGNVFSDGPITGTGNNVSGDVISAGPGGLISNINVGGSAYAHSLENSDVVGDAYYQAISGTTVHGVKHPASADQATSTLPIPDSLIAEWETAAAAGGTVTCSSGHYNTPSNVTLGPVKVPCDLNISGDNVTLAGPIWVTGDINISGSSIVKVSSSLSGKTVPIIADNPSNRSSGSQINMANSSVFQGSGLNSYVLLVSQNNSAEQGGSNDAISISNSVSGAILVYAAHGNISIANSVQLKEVAAYKISMSNSSEVNYETGLASLLFSAGPGGGYTIGVWKEVQ